MAGRAAQTVLVSMEKKSRKKTKLHFYAENTVMENERGRRRGNVFQSYHVKSEFLIQTDWKLTQTIKQQLPFYLQR